MKKILLMVALMVPAQAGAFSDSFKEYMTDLQSRTMLKQQKFTSADLKRCWDKFDEEVASFLEKTQKEEALNKEGAATELSVTERHKEEIENIELGEIEAKFYKIDGRGKVWLVALTNDMMEPTGTFRIFKNEGGKFVRAASLEEASGPWNEERIGFTRIQIQPIAGGLGKTWKFASYHLPYEHGSRGNRSQIIWEYNGSLKPVLYVPEVDWHQGEDGSRVAGHGDVVPVP